MDELNRLRLAQAEADKLHASLVELYSGTLTDNPDVCDLLAQALVSSEAIRGKLRRANRFISASPRH